MGWYGSPAWKSKEDVARDVYPLAEGYTYLAESTLRREAGVWVLWAVVRTPEGEGIITCTLISREGGMWRYKAMDETVGPYYHSCPREFLTVAQPAPDSDYSRAWRERVLSDTREWHARMAAGAGR